MKNFLLIATVLFMVSCKKEKDTNQPLSCNPLATMGDSINTTCYITNSDSAIINVNNFNTAVDYDLDMDGIADIQLRVEKFDNTPTAQTQQYERIVNINPSVFDVAVMAYDTTDNTDIINYIPNWTAQSNIATLMYYEQPYPPNPPGSTHFDPTPSFNSIPFIIYRKNVGGVYKYGWAYVSYLKPCATFCYYNRIAIGPANLQQ